jgi:hypothetical protein
MHDHHIRESVRLLLKNKLISSSQADDAYRVLKSQWDKSIAIVWGFDDVRQVAGDLSICSPKRVTNKIARSVLDAVLERHDATVGINWDVLAYHLENHIPKPHKNEQKHH